MKQLRNLLFLSIPFLSYSPIVWANTPIADNFCQQPNYSVLESLNEDIVKNTDISANGLTIPSLWWAKEQFDPFNGKLIQSWVANHQTATIDLIVNRQLWTILDYMARYRLVNQIGTVAREYQYNLRILNQQQTCLALYQCDFSQSPYQCEIKFNSTESRGFQLEN